MARGIDFGQATCQHADCGREYSRVTPTSLYCSAACGYSAKKALQKAQRVSMADDEGWKSLGVTHSGYSERRPAPEVIPVPACARCKRMAHRDGHALWCDGSPAEPQRITQSPVTVRYVAPSYVEPAPKPKREPELVKASTDEVLAKMAAKKKPAKVKRAAATKGEPKPRKSRAKPRVNGPTGICAYAACGGQIVGRKPAAIYCSEACNKRADYARRIGYKTAAKSCVDCAADFETQQQTAVRCPTCRAARVKVQRLAAQRRYRRRKRTESDVA